MMFFKRSTYFSCNCQKDKVLVCIQNAACDVQSSFKLKSINENEISLRARNPFPFAMDSFLPDMKINIVEFPSGCCLSVLFTLQRSMRIWMIVFYSIALLCEFFLIIFNIPFIPGSLWSYLLIPLFLIIFLCIAAIRFHMNTTEIAYKLIDLF